MSSAFFRPCWAEISRRQFDQNFRQLQDSLPPKTGILAVVKANAYGHGAVSVSRWAQALGARMLGVASIEEGIELRRHGIRTSILVLGTLFPFREAAKACVHYKLVPTVASLAGARAMAASAKKARKTLAVHVKVDTGMGRIGISPQGALGLLKTIRQEPSLHLEGLYTHLSSAGEDPAYTAKQLSLFEEVVRSARQEGLNIPWIHAANSHAIISKTGLYNLVRPGLALYGLAGSYTPILQWKTRVIFWKRVPAGTPLGYSRTYVTKRQSHIATLAIGYADGLSRRLSNRGHVLIQGRRVPIVGMISMDMTLVDVTDVGHVEVGEEAVVVGRQRQQEITIREMAASLDTIPYEIVCGIGRRVNRTHTR